MARRRSLTTFSLIVATAIGASALLAQPAGASERFSETFASALCRFEAPIERIQLWFALGSRPVAQPQEGAAIVVGGKEGAAIVVGGKEGAAIVVGGIANPSRSRQPAGRVDLDRNY